MITDFFAKKNSSPSLNTVFSFGSHQGDNYGEFVFQNDGTIYGYQNNNEFRWSVIDGQLCFLNIDGIVTSRFDMISKDVFLGRSQVDRVPLYLLPLITLAESPCKSFSPGFLVNTIPKAGTYFLEAALSTVGSKPVRLHLSGENLVDDNRLLNDDEIHVSPEKVRLQCSNKLIASLLNGRTAVGHIEKRHVIEDIRSQGVLVFNVKRNLRDVLVSMYRFKLNKVKSRGGMDDSWREISEKNRFLAFLNYYSDKDFLHVSQVADMILNDNDSVLLSYEDMCNGNIPQSSKDKIDQHKSGLATLLAQAMKSSYSKKNPTFSGKRSNWEELWNDDIESWFSRSGFKRLNEKLEYL